MRVLEDRNHLVEVVEGLANQGDFAVSLGKAALMADPENLKTLAYAFPSYFTKKKAITLIWTQQ
jgi:hypothetical protein